ncbi:MAG: PSD1 domain-containing protein [Pirellulales bacterium]|nr:PSD1 domain-containing protein [Pirellulales bacterium]
MQASRLLTIGLRRLALLAMAAQPAAAGEVDFNRDVRPILAENCFACHGPDPAHREADLRLDAFAAASDDVLGAESVVTPGDPAGSALIERITSDDPDLRMPPTDSGKELTRDQIELLRRWIAEGARYEQHWAFVAPQRPDVPPVSDSPWVQNPIDAFILARLEHEGLRPSVAADRNTLLRRLSLDLTGLPPTLAELAAYERAAAADPAAAYAAQVERLLAAPAFGERWARLWLDAARYADSDGFEKDKPRFVWMYRDWVIAALNADKPYDQFIVEQIAGDLLPGATQDQRVATGFLRNSMINEEGGIDPEQFRMEAMFDRMDAVGKAILGLTIQCAQCHSHKYDPIEHADYYRMFAFLNNCDEAQMSAYTLAEQAQWSATEKLIRQLEDELKSSHPDWPQRLAAWEQSEQPPARSASKGDGRSDPVWTVVKPQLDSSGGQKHYLLDDGSILAAGYAPTKHDTEFTVEVGGPATVTAVRLELLNDPNLPHGGPGRSIYGTCALTEFQVTAAPLAADGKTQKLKIASATADVNPPARPLDAIYDDRSGQRRVTGPIEYANDGDDLTAWGIDVGPQRCNAPHNAVFVLEKPLEVQGGMRLTFRLVQNHGGWNSDDNQNHNLGRFRFSLTDAEKPQADPVPAAVRAILAIPASERTADQADEVFGYWRTTVPEWSEANRRLEALWESHPRGTTQLVLSERAAPRKTHRLQRGDFLKPAEEVAPGVPAFLHPLPAAEPLANSAEDQPASPPHSDVNIRQSPPQHPNRLDFARWLADRRSPTTARAIVNRLWQAYFGAGLVATPEDLGTQGAVPTHPELLDWLAVELMDNGWSLKHIHRLIVTSAAYQQSAAVSPDLLARDPSNELLARGPRFRVSAETVRDIALAASGLLYRKVGGPSVYPPAPEFLFQPPTSYGPKTWAHDDGPDQYRRALYTFRYRSVPYPALETFDAPRGDVACVRRVRSNTPLQALTTLNETLYLACARELARRTVAEGGDSDESRLAYAFRRCLSRQPRPEELATLSAFVARQKDHFASEGADPAAFIADSQEQSPPAANPAQTAELAAWTALARVVLNLDETITKE